MSFVKIWILYFTINAIVLLVKSQTNILLSSWWNSDFALGKNILQGPSGCKLELFYLTRRLTIYSKISDLEQEQNNLNSINPRYTIGDKNEILQFIVPTLIQNTPGHFFIDQIYPRDMVLVQLAFRIIQLFPANTEPLKNILILINKTKDPNNPDIDNYENIIQYLNTRNLVDVSFLEYSTVDNLITFIRSNAIFQIITFLSDPAVNKELIRKMYLNNLMIWKYRWLIFDLLGGDPDMNTVEYRNGTLSNNVTLVSFTKSISGTENMMRTINDLLCLNQTTFSTVTGDFQSNQGVIKRINFKFYLSLNPGPSKSLLGEVVVGLPNGYYDDAVTFRFDSSVKYNEFSLNLSTSRDALRARVLRIGFQNYPPYCFRDANNVPTGFMVELIEEIMRRQKVPYTYIELNANLATGVFDPLIYRHSGLLGLLEKGEIDFVAIPMIKTVNRLTHFDYVVNFLSGYLAGVYKIPNKRGFEAMINYINPFTWETWVTFIGSVFAVTFAIAFADHIEPDRWTRYRLHKSLFFSVSSVTHGAYFDPPEKRGIRIVMSFWWAFCILVVIMWAANYTSLLAKEKTEKNITSFFGLLGQKKFTYGTLNDKLVFTFLEKDQNSQPQLLLRLLRDEQINGTVSKVSDVANMIKSTSYAFLYDDKTVRYMANTECLDLFGRWMNYEYGIVLAKYSELVLALQEETAVLQASGFTNNLSRKYWPTYNPNCESQDWLNIITRNLKTYFKNPYENALDSDYMIGVFAVLLLGGIAILLAACIERVIRLVIQKRRDHLERSQITYTIHQLQM